MALRRLVLLVCAIVLVDTTFYAVVAPLLPSFADELDLSKASAGLLVAAYPAGTLVAAVPCGLLAARVGPRTTAIVGLVLLGGSSVAFGFADDIVLLDLARFVQGVGGACTWAGALAWLVVAAPPSRRGELIGTALGAGIAGALFGPVVGAVAEATSPEVVFSGVAGVAAVLVAWSLATPCDRTPEVQRLADLPRALRRPRVAGAMWLVTLPALAFGAIGVLGPLRLDALGAGGAAVAATFLVAAGLEAVTSPLVGRLSDRRGPLVPLRAGLAAGAVMLCLITLPTSALLLSAVIVLAAGTLGVFWAPAMSMLSDQAEGAGLSQGMAFSLVNLAWAGGQVAGSAVGGPVAKATADAVPLTVVAVLCAATLVALQRVRRGGAVVASA